MSRRRAAFGLGCSLACAGLAFLAFRLLADRSLAVTCFGQRYALLRPEFLAPLSFVPLLIFGVYGSLADLPRAQRFLSLGLRSLLLLVLALCLARPARSFDATRVSAVLLIDDSDSVSAEDRTRALELAEAALAARGDNDLQLVRFAVRPEPLALPSAQGGLSRTPSSQRHGDVTDIQAAVQLAYGLFPAAHLKRIALLSDGLETRGDLLAEAERARQLGVRIDYVLLDRGSPPEVAALSLALPDHIAVGESFELRARLFASQPAQVRVRLYQDGVLNGLDAVRDLELARGDNELTWKSVVRSAGEVVYRLTLEPKGPDRFSANNAVSATAIVPGRPSVLVLDLDPNRARALADVLRSADFEVDLRSALALPRSLGEFARYDFVVMSDLGVEQLGSESIDALERYVRDLGGGLLFAGGTHSYGLGGLQGTRMEALLPVWMDSERRRDQQTLALALVIDCSGSMSGQKIELAKDAAKAAAELLGADDALSVVGFAGEPQRFLRMQSARNRLHIAQSIDRLSAQGGTAIFPALDMAFQDLLSQSARVKHVILLTDGQTQESGIPELVAAMRAEGITVSTVGLGNDVNRGLLQHAASVGGGRAYFTNDPHNVPRIFVRETTTVGQNSAVEELVRMRPVEPADFLKGIDLESAPLLRGYIATRPKGRPAQVVLASELGEPLLARWRLGLGWVLAWTSDLQPRWAADLLRWRALPTWLGQLVREHMRERRHDELPLEAAFEGDTLVASVDALGADDRFIDGLESELTLDGPLDGASDRIRKSVALRQRAPGRYEARIPLPRYGTFSLNALHRKDDRVIARSHAQVSHPYPDEYRGLAPNGALLQQAAQRSGGRALGDMRELFERGDERISAERELWPYLVALALCMFILDVSLRRVRWFERTRGPAETRHSGVAGPDPRSGLD